MTDSVIVKTPLLDVQENISLRDFTTYHIGGPARFFCKVHTLEELIAAIRWSTTQQLSWFILGHGSNVLISDKGFSGLVVKLGRDFQNIHLDIKKNTITAGAAVMLPRLGLYLASHGYAGCPYMYGIPGTVGGAVRMNAGTRTEGQIQDDCLSVKILMPDLSVCDKDAKAMEFSYRHSCLVNDQGIVIEAVFRAGEKLDPSLLMQKREIVLTQRQIAQPHNGRTCGSVFKNPPGARSAGWYIDQTGLKGLQINGAQISSLHANWIINLGNAHAQDVKQLIQIVQDKVYAQFHVRLERELWYVPEDIRPR